MEDKLKKESAQQDLLKELGLVYDSTVASLCQVVGCIETAKKTHPYVVESLKTLHKTLLRTYTEINTCVEKNYYNQEWQSREKESE